MKRTKDTAEFKEEAFKQVIDKGHTVVDVAKRLGIAEGVLYTWVSKFKKVDEPESSDLRVKYAFIQAHRTEFRLTSMCRVLKVHRSGYYAWLHEPQSPRAKANEALTVQIREFFDQTIGIYASLRIFCDLREAGVACGENRVAI